MISLIDAFLTHVFDHEVGATPWYFSSSSAPDWRQDPEINAGLVSETFENAERLLSRYSDEQLENGLKYLVDPSCGNILAGILERPLSPQADDRLSRSFASLFKSVFARRCTPCLSSLGEEGAPLNLLCYMWWDLLPWHGDPEVGGFRHRDEGMLSAMETTLSLPHDACREAALHGLGHWQSRYPSRVERAIDSFIRENAGLRPELQRYAQSARAGLVN